MVLRDSITTRYFIIGSVNTSIKILLPENGKEECFFKMDFDELCVLNLACIRMKERKSSLLQLISHEQAFGCSPNSH